MGECKSCGKKGLLLRIEKDTGLCLSCKADFAEKAKPLAAKLMEVENLNLASRTDDMQDVVNQCKAVEESAQKLLDLKKEYGLEPGAELQELLNKYCEIRKKALDKM